MKAAAGGILDATLVEAFLHPARAFEQDDLARLVTAFPLAGIRSAVPVLPDAHPNATRLLPAEPAADVLEPLERTAHTDLLARLGSSKRDGDRPIVVDADGARVGETLFPLTVPSGLVREAVVWTRPDRPRDEQYALLARTVAPLPLDTRVRLRDPHGVVLPQDVPRLLEIVPATRLTLWVEDAHRMAQAVAHVALAQPTPPLVRTTLLGIGPRTGAPATELLHTAHHHEEVLSLCGATGHRVPDTHPLWGPRLREATEPELIAWSEHAPRANYGRPVGAPLHEGPLVPRFAPGTLRPLVLRFLADWGAPDDPALAERLVAAVAARMRPGERPDGPTLYTIAATVLDLARLATATRPGKEAPEDGT